MTKKSRLVVVGVGLVGRRHVDAIGAVRSTVLAGIVDPAEDAAAYAETSGAPHFADLDAMFEAIRPDGVILATPTLLHVEQGLACVARRCPTLVEKPIAISTSDAERLVTAAEANDTPLLTGHHRRHNPLIRKAFETIGAGALGAIRSVHSQCWFYKPNPYFEQAPWRMKTGAGPISVNLVHDIDLVRHLCGDVVSVQAQAAPSARGYENEDVASALLRFEHGAIGTVTVSDSIAAPWSWEHTSQEFPVYPPTRQSCLLIGGSQASLSVPDLTLWSHGETPDWWSPMSATTLIRDASDPLVNQIAQFAAVIRGEAEPLVSGREGLNTLRVIEAIQEAARTGALVHVAS